METAPTRLLHSVPATASVQEAAVVMADRGFGALGVRGDDDSFLGLITDRDLTWFVARGMDPRRSTVGEIVNDFPVVVDGPIDVATARARMEAARVRHLLVRQAGEMRILSIRDLQGPDAMAEQAIVTVRDAMTAPAIACHEGSRIDEIAEILAERSISGMPVVSAGGEVVGVISERDLAHALGGPMVRLALRRRAEAGGGRDVVRPPEGYRARDVMTSPAVTTSVDTSLDEAARVMRVQKVNRLPVLDEGRLVGVITRGDVLSAIAHLEHRYVDLDRPPIVVGHVEPGVGPGRGAADPAREPGYGVHQPTGGWERDPGRSRHHGHDERHRPSRKG